MRHDDVKSILQTTMMLAMYRSHSNIKQQQQRNEDGNAAQHIVQATHRTMRAKMTATNQLTGDGYVPEAAQNGIIIVL